MPLKCSVTGCKSNYHSCSNEYISVFKFPTDETLRQEWLKKIPRSNWSPGPTARVCELHFESRFVSKTEEFIHNGEKKIFPRKRPLLLPMAIPTIFPNLPSYLSSSVMPERANVGEKRRKFVTDQHEKSIDNFFAHDKILNFKTLKSGYQKYVNSPLWKFDISDTFVAYIPDFPKIAVCIQINANLEVTVHQNEFIVPASELNWLIHDSHLTLFSQLENLLNRFAINLSTFKPSQNMLQEKILSCWNQLIEFFEDDVEGSIKRKKLRFLREQFSLAICNYKVSRRYSPEMIIYSFMMHMLSPACYDGLKKNLLLTLPHEKRLLQLSRSFGVAADNAPQNEHFLKLKCDQLEERAKYVVVQLDEVYVKQKIDYKNGKLYGYAANGDKACAAKTILAVLISSAYADFKEVVALCPVHKLTGADLFDIITAECLLINRCGFKIVVIISDNNRINRNLFQRLCGSQAGELPDLTFHVTADISTEHRVFCTYDSVHVFKSWRNNWLREKSQTFCYPDWDDFNQIRFAKFSVLRDIYESEKNSLLKLAPKLNQKTLYPSNLERQQVSLALNLIDESTISAVKEKHENETAAFLEIISSWWSIMNIKNQFLHILKRKDLAKPFVSVQDDRLVFLKKFLKWLERWKPVPKNGGFLTDDTHCALYRQTAVMIQFIEYSLTELKVSYVLPGKIQTDLLEKQFSKYRSMSGNNYNVSVAQVLESEKKLRITSLLGLKSARYGYIHFHMDDFAEFTFNEEELEKEYPDPRELDLLVDFFDDDFEEVELPLSAVLYVSGYVAFKMSKKLTCQSCIDIFNSRTSVDDQYFTNINRGGLSVPSDICLELGKLAFLIMQQLISKKYEMIFVKCFHQKKLLLYLLKESLDLCFGCDMNDKCDDCNSNMYNVFSRSLPIFSNILLNNYVKNVNNNNNVCDDKSRKLSTLK